jgi:hypothetical protein
MWALLAAEQILRNLQRWNMEEESSFLDYMVVCKLCVDKLFLLSLVRIPTLYHKYVASL